MRWSIAFLVLALGCATTQPAKQTETVQALRAKGTFADVRAGGHWLFDPDAEGVADMPVVVTDRTKFVEGGKKVDGQTKPAVRPGQPVIVTYRVLPDGTLELLEIDSKP